LKLELMFVDSQASYFRFQSGSRDAQFGRGAGWAGDLAPALGQGGLNQFFFLIGSQTA